MSSVRFNSGDVKKALQAVRDIAEKDVVMRRVEKEMQYAVEHIMNVAVDKTPMAEGTLRRSAHTQVELRGVTLTGRVVYGGQAATYAEKQHENVHFKHTLPPGVSRTHTASGKRRQEPIRGYKGGQAKYLFGRGPDGPSAWEERGPAMLKLLENKHAEHARKYLEEHTP